MSTRFSFCIIRTIEINTHTETNWNQADSTPMNMKWQIELNSIKLGISMMAMSVELNGFFANYLLYVMVTMMIHTEFNWVPNSVGFYGNHGCGSVSMYRYICIFREISYTWIDKSNWILNHVYIGYLSTIRWISCIYVMCAKEAYGMSIKPYVPCRLSNSIGSYPNHVYQQAYRTKILSESIVYEWCEY